jgi:hypothetical protein
MKYFLCVNNYKHGDCAKILCCIINAVGRNPKYVSTVISPLSGLGDRGSIFYRGAAPVLGLWPNEPPIQLVPGVKQPGREADHSPPSTAEVKNV